MAFVPFSVVLPSSNRARVATCSTRHSTFVHRHVTPRAAPAFVPCRVSMSQDERTFIAVKPDGMNRGLLGNIISRFEAKGYKLVGIKTLVPSRQLAETHYASLSSKPFFAGLVDFITSGPVCAMVWEGEGVVTTARKMIGETNPLASNPGTIRGDFGVDVGRNVIHGSDAVDTANREIGIWFEPSELCTWSPTASVWIYE